MHMQSRARMMCALLGATALAGCGGASAGSAPIAQFPSQEALAAISAKPAAKPAFPEESRVVDEWALEQAPLPDAGSQPRQPEGPWETMFTEVAAKAQRRPRVTMAMSCVAREVGRFYLQHKAIPDASLRRYLVGACGGLAAGVGVGFVAGQAPADAPDEELFAQIGGDLRAQLEQRFGGGADVAGFWFGRREGQVVAVIALGEEEAEIKPFSLVPDAQGEVVIEGRLKGEAQHFEAYINHGRAAVEACHSDLSVARPAFRFVCRPAADDEAAWVQMLFAPPGRVLATTFAQALVRRSPDMPPAYKATRYADPAPVSKPEEFTRAAIQALNRARKEAGLRAVTLAARESATAAKLAPHYFDATLGRATPQQADVIALGLLAGWEVGGMIRGADLMSELAPTLDAGRWLTSALEMPLGRHTLFARDIEQVAFGPYVWSDPGAIGAVVAGYRFHHGNDHTGDVNMLLDRVVQSRRRMGLPEPKRLGTVAQIMKEELAAVHEGRAMPRDAMQAVLNRAANAFATGMQGYVMEASSLEELQIPEDVLRQPTLHLDIGVTHHKAPGAAWAQYTILVIYAILDTSTT